MEDSVKIALSKRGETRIGKNRLDRGNNHNVNKSHELLIKRLTYDKKSNE